MTRFHPLKGTLAEGRAWRAARARLALLVLGALLVLSAVIAGCGGPPAERPASESAGDARQAVVYVQAYRWHTEVVVPRSAAAAGGLPARYGLSAGESHLSIGWGEMRFFTARRPRILDIIPAAFWPTASVVRITPLNGPTGRARETVAVPVSADELASLTRFLGRSLGPGSNRDAPQPLATAGSARFYPARGGYHLFNTCNTWTLRALQSMGCDAAAMGGITVDHVLPPARQCARDRTVSAPYESPPGRDP